MDQALALTAGLPKGGRDASWAQGIFGHRKEIPVHVLECGTTTLGAGSLAWATWISSAGTVDRNPPQLHPSS
jgi:hypothetical protein